MVLAVGGIVSYRRRQWWCAISQDLKTGYIVGATTQSTALLIRGFHQHRPQS